jgi:alginate O-acetyltransferase complex protein AlgI
MLFTSPVFLYLFLPGLLGLYFLLPGRNTKNVLLLIFSLFFYAWGEGIYLLILLCSVFMNYSFGNMINEAETDKHKKISLALAITTNLGLLASFKYVDFLVQNLNILLELVSLETIVKEPTYLPIGISFFTFQAMSYLIDVYREETEVQANPFRLALYIALFPQLIAGPIIRYHDVYKQLSERKESLELFYSGLRRFVYGLAKKLIIANPLGHVADIIFGLDSGQLSTSLAWLGIVCYTLQIYFDFSAYSDMAIGLGRMFGFRFLENFNYPYISSSIQEFWRRWHISLSRWFRDYLYIPLGGNRCSPTRLYLNLVTVFFLCGLWHGASWNFVIWGLIHGCFLVAERNGLAARIQQIWQPLAHIYALLVVMFAWVFFRCDDLSSSMLYLKALAGMGSQSPTTYSVGYLLDTRLLFTLAVALPCCLPFIRNLLERLEQSPIKNDDLELRPATPLTAGKRNTPAAFLDGAILVTLMFLCMTYVASGTYNPFIYFRF